MLVEGGKFRCQRSKLERMNHLKMLLNVLDANVPEPAYWQKSEKESIMKNPALKERKNPRLLARGNISFLCISSLAIGA